MNNESSKKILLVEDEIITTMLEKKQLENAGYIIDHVTNGEEAVKIIIENNQPIDLILMDIDLGSGIDGTQAAEQILIKKDIPIVFLSSHTDPEIVEKTEKITSYGYVVKNSSFTVLDASIKMAFKLFESNFRLHESRNQLNAIIDSTEDLIWSVDPINFGLVTFNKGLFNYFLNKRNISIETGMCPKDLFPSEEFILKWENFYKQAIHDGSFIIEYQTFSDSVIIDITINQIKIDNVIIGLSVFGKDITERKKIENELINSKKQYQMMFDSLPFAIYITDNFHQNVEYINPYFTKMLGYELNDILTIQDWMNLAYPDPDHRNKTIEEVFNNLKESLSKNEPLIEMESIISCKNGLKKNILWKQVQFEGKGLGCGIEKI